MNYDEAMNITDVEPLMKKMKPRERQVLRRLFGTSENVVSDDRVETAPQPSFLSTLQEQATIVLVITFVGVVVSFVPRAIVPLTSDFIVNVIRCLLVALVSAVALYTLKH